jgi:hypothetical protein
MIALKCYKLCCMVKSIILHYLYRGLKVMGKVMSIQASRDARCNGTPFLPDVRIACNVLRYRQARCASILQLSFSYHIGL